jgi:hypothetical protein
LSTPGRPQISDTHYPHHPGGSGPKTPRPKARTAAEIAFLDLGPGAHKWLVEAASLGVQRIKTKMAGAVELAAMLGAEQVDAALMLAASAGRFDDGGIASITDHLAFGRPQLELVRPGEEHSAQQAPAPGTR